MVKQERSFNPKWFDEFNFLHYWEENDSVICHTCAVADKNNLFKIDTKEEKTFTETGFSNWKKAIEKFVAHARSTTHIHATEVLNIVKLAQCCLVMSASNATRERAFSAMRCIMTYLRNSMSQNSLNHTICINVHSEKVDSIDWKLLLNEFIDSNDRRKDVFAQI